MGINSCFCVNSPNIIVVDNVVWIFYILTNICYLVVLSFIKGGDIIQYATIIAGLSVSPFSSVFVIYLEDLLLGAYPFMILCLPDELTLLSL